MPVSIQSRPTFHEFTLKLGHYHIIDLPKADIDLSHGFSLLSRAFEQTMRLCGDTTEMLECARKMCRPTIAQLRRDFLDRLACRQQRSCESKLQGFHPEAWSNVKHCAQMPSQMTFANSEATS